MGLTIPETDPQFKELLAHGKLWPGYLGPQEPEVTIASGVISVFGPRHTVATEGAAASDNVDTVNGWQDGKPYVMRPASDSGTVVWKHGTGNLLCAGNADITCDDAHDAVILIGNVTLNKVIVLPFGGGGAGGGHALYDEGNALATEPNLDFIGKYMQARDNAASTATKLYAAYSHYDAIVDSAECVTLYSGAVSSATATTITVAGTPWTADQWNRARVLMTSGAKVGESSVITATTTNKITFGALSGAPSAADTFIIIPDTPVFPTLIGAVYYGAEAILYRKGTDATDFTITSSHSVNYILGSAAAKQPGSGEITINLTITKQGVILQNLAFMGSNKVTTLGGLGNTAIGCVWGSPFSGSQSSRVVLSGGGASLIACAFAGLSSSNDSITVSAEGTRIQACQFLGCGISGNHIKINAGRTVIVGNLFIGLSETGAFIGSGGAANNAISGNFFYMPSGVPGALSGVNLGGYNISGNFFYHEGGSSGTYTIISAIAKCIVTGNSFIVATMAGTISMKQIVTTAGAGNVITGNSFASPCPIGTSAVYICVEAGAGSLGNIITGNQFALATTSSGRAIGLNALATDYVFKDNAFLVGNFSGVRCWKPIFNTGGGSALGPRSVVKSNPGFPDFEGYQAAFREDFEKYTAAATYPTGWVSVVTLGGAVTMNQDSRNGVVELTTGAAVNSIAGIYLNSNHVSLLSQDPSFQVHIAGWNTTLVNRVRLGFHTRANWAALGGAMPIGNDYMLLCYDSAVSANWQLRWRIGGGAEVVVDTGVAAAASATGQTFMFGIDQYPLGYVWAFINGIYIDTNTPSTSIPSALMTPGAWIQQNGGAGNQLYVDSISWGDARA